MRLRHYETAQEFAAATGEALAAAEAANNLLLGITGELVDTPQRYSGSPYLAAVWRDGDPLVVAVRTPPFGAVLSLPRCDLRRTASGPAESDWLIEDATGILVADLAATAPDLPGVLGPSGPARLFASRWQRATGTGVSVSQRERIYEAHRVVPPTSVPGADRPAGPADAGLLLRWLADFHSEAFPPGTPRHRPEQAVAELLAGRARRARLWEVEGRPVSVACSGSPTPRGIRIGPVFTPPDHRGHGYASAVTAAATQAELTSGRTMCFLFTDLANPVSNRIYTAIGYSPVVDVEQFVFGAAAPR